MPWGAAHATPGGTSPTRHHVRVVSNTRAPPAGVSSSGRWSLLARLQARCAAATLSIVSVPPLFNGVTWSMTKLRGSRWSCIP